METFEDFVRHYNNHDVIGLVEGIKKMLEIENDNNLDLFKDSISLPGITQKYLFKNLEEGDYFVGIGKEHAHIYKQLRELGIVGGPSIIFHRYQEAGKTLIKNNELCQSVYGYDANSLYLDCSGKDMPTGDYVLREKKDNFKKPIRYSKVSLQWLEYKSIGKNIRHAENSVHGEKRIGNVHVDGFCAETNTIFEFYGCYHHGHGCKDKHDPEKWRKTMEREEELRAKGFNIESITECEWKNNPASSISYKIQKKICTEKDLENAVISGESFGIIKCDLHVPENRIDHFSEFPPIFKNTEITMADIGEHMQEYCRDITRKEAVKRSLISSMWGKDLVILTPLFKKYIEMGLICDKIEWIMEYNPKPVFNWFKDEVVNDRRMADLDPDWIIRGETSKTRGNAFYGRMLMNKAFHTNTTFTNDKNIQKS